MQTGKVYALLVGINNYPAMSGVSNLGGCLEDVQRIHGYLSEQFVSRNSDLLCDSKTVRILRDEEATTTALIRAFRDLLSQAGPEDSVYFHFSGHGSRQPAAPEFFSFFPDEFDETLVCYNSRLPGQFDLADKELAVLLSELNAGHILVTLDCCHSGSGVREDEDSLKVRTAPVRTNTRPLQSYIAGYYENQVRRSGNIEIPGSKHILLAACNRFQKAREHQTGVGLFTRALTRVLANLAAPISYVELFSRVRSMVFLKKHDQTPEFENHGGASPLLGFMGQELPLARTAPMEGIYTEGGKYYMPIGAINGLSYGINDDNFAVVSNGKTVGRAKFKSIGPERSEIVWTTDPVENRSGKLQALPDLFWTNRSIVGLMASPPICEKITSLTPDRMRIKWDEPGDQTEFTIVENEGKIELRKEVDSSIIQFLHEKSDAKLLNLLLVLEQVLFWTGFSRLIPPKMNDLHTETQINLWLIEEGRNGSKFNPLESVVKMPSTQQGLHPQFRITNESGQTLNFALFHLSRQYGVRSLANQPIPPSGTEVILWGGLDDEYIYIPSSRTSSTEIFQVIVSESPIQTYMLERDSLTIGGEVGPDRDLQKRYPDLEKWTLRTFRIELELELDQLP